eukprot:180141-Pleurochrysis_carterae.AAC.1
MASPIAERTSEMFHPPIIPRIAKSFGHGEERGRTERTGGRTGTDSGPDASRRGGGVPCVLFV